MERIALKRENLLLKNSEIKKTTIDQELNPQYMKTHNLFLSLTIALLLLLGFFGCKDNPGPDLGKGNIKIIIITQGDNTEGYEIQIQGKQQSHIASNDTLQSGNLNDGTYKVELLELPEDCSVKGLNPVTVKIEDAEEATVTFEVNCGDALSDTGTLQIITNTSPDYIDFSYILLINGTDEYDVTANDNLVFNNLEFGSYTLKLNELPENCSLEGDNPRLARIENKERVTITLDITCHGSLEILTNTSLIHSEEIYTIHVNNQQFAIGANDRLLIENIDPGTYQAELRDLPSNCNVRGDNPQEFTVTAEYTVDYYFDIFCQTIFNYKWIYPSVGIVEGHSIQVLYPDQTRESLSPVFRYAGSVRVSHDNSKVAFTGSDYDNWDLGHELFVSDSDGANLVQLTHQPDDPEVGGFSWSHDDKRLAFTGGGSNTTSNMYIINKDGSGLSQITDHETSYDYAPIWTQDGSKLVFRRRDGDSNDIYIMNSDGSNLKNITNTPNIVEGSPGWTSDGLRIRYAEVDGGRYKFYTSNPDGSDRKLILQIEDEDIYGFSWSPDETKIAYSKIFYDSDATGEDLPPDTDWGFDIYVMDADGSNHVKLTHTEKIGFANRNPSWSPDGKYIIFTQQLWFTDEVYIFTMNADGSEINRIGSDGCCFTWLPLD